MGIVLTAADTAIKKARAKCTGFFHSNLKPLRKPKTASDRDCCHKKGPVGVEPTRDGFAIRRSNDVTAGGDENCDDGRRMVVPMVVPAHDETTCDTVRQSTLDVASETSSGQRPSGVNDPVLADVVARWDSLPEHVRQAIVTLVKVAGSDK